MEKAGATPADVDDVIVHATTVVTNAVLTRSGQPTALFVTEGFKDVLFIRDEHRYDMFDPQIEYADPIVPRDLTWGVAERTLANGTVSMNIDEVQIRQFSAEMREKGVDAVGICLLNAYVNGTNEQRVRDICCKNGRSYTCRSRPRLRRRSANTLARQRRRLTPTHGP